MRYTVGMSTAAALKTIELLLERFDDVVDGLGGYPETVPAERRAAIRFDLINLRRLLLVAAFTSDPGLTWFRFRCARALILLPNSENAFTLEGAVQVIDARTVLRT